MTTDIVVADDQYAPAIGTGTTAGAALGVLDMYADAIDKAYNFAEKLCRTPLVGNVYRGKPADAAVAILYGAELGLNPIQSLQNVFTVHGTPTVYSRTMVAMLKVRGYRIDPIESSDESVTVVGYSPTGQEVASTWTIERAVKAGYVPQRDDAGEFKRNANGKLIGNEKYLTDPQAMLYAKAAAEVCRKLAPDVLLGIASSREDLESEPEPTSVRVTSERVTVGEVVDQPAHSGPPVQQWQAPADERPDEDAASQEGEDPDTEPPAEERPAKPAKPSTRTQQNKVARLLDERGITAAADKLSTIGEFFDRTFASSAELTWDEAIRLLAHLEDDPVANDSQLKQLSELLGEVGLVEDAEIYEFLSLKAGRTITTLSHLTGGEANTIAHLISDSLRGPAATDETAGGAE